MDRIKLLINSLLIVLLFTFSATTISAQHGGDHPQGQGHGDDVNDENIDTALDHDATQHDKGFDLSAFILHHVSDDYKFHVIGDSTSAFGEVVVHLPVIIYEPGKGFDVFMSSELEHVDHTTHLSHGKYYYHHGKLLIPEIKDGQIVKDEHGEVVGKHEARLTDIGSSHVFYNFSITKNVFGLLLSFAILLLIFIPVARAYRKRGVDSAPKGTQNLMEILILFVQNEIAIPFIGEKKYRKFLPYLLTLFFFIWINNLLGLIPIFPGSANVSGNIAFTFTLAFLSLILVFAFGNKNFWGHIFWYPGVPVPVKILLAILEFIGVFTKPFSLMIRLFANITAGHIIIMSIIGITFLMKSIGVGIGTSIFSVAMFVLELLVAAIQAYIFTLLTAQMIGAAVEESHHAHEEHAHAEHH